MGRGSKREIVRRRVLVVDDHPMVCEGLAQILNQQRDLNVCGCCHSAKEALSEISRAAPDIVVVDIGLQGVNGIDLIKQIKAFHPKLSIVVLSMHDERVYAERALKAGALGYVMKKAAIDDILEAIRRALGGQRYLSSRMQYCLVQLFAGPTLAKPVVESLTDRELQVFALIGNGSDAREIAKQLNITMKTVDTYRINIRDKLGLRNAPEVVRAAVEFARKHAQ